MSSLVVSVGFVVLALLFIYNNLDYDTSQSNGRNNELDCADGVCDDFSIEISDINLLMNGEVTGLIYFGRDTRKCILSGLAGEDNFLYIFNNFCYVRLFRYDPLILVL